MANFVGPMMAVFWAIYGKSLPTPRLIAPPLSLPKYSPAPTPTPHPCPQPPLQLHVLHSEPTPKHTPYQQIPYPHPSPHHTPSWPRSSFSISCSTPTQPDAPSPTHTVPTSSGWKDSDRGTLKTAGVDGDEGGEDGIGRRIGKL